MMELYRDLDKTGRRGIVREKGCLPWNIFFIRTYIFLDPFHCLFCIIYTISFPKNDINIFNLLMNGLNFQTNIKPGIRQEDLE